MTGMLAVSPTHGTSLSSVYTTMSISFQRPTMAPLGHSHAVDPQDWHTNLAEPGQSCCGDADGSQHAALLGPHGVQLPEGLGGLGLGGVGLGGVGLGPLGHSHAADPQDWHANFPGQNCCGDADGSQHAALLGPHGVQLPEGLGGLGLGGVGLGGLGGLGATPEGQKKVTLYCVVVVHMIVAVLSSYA
jgi:hypothetical protein